MNFASRDQSKQQKRVSALSDRSAYLRIEIWPLGREGIPSKFFCSSLINQSKWELTGGFSRQFGLFELPNQLVMELGGGGGGGPAANSLKTFLPGKSQHFSPISVNSILLSSFSQA